MTNNVKLPMYQCAEDTFLSAFCSIERFEWGSRYGWAAGGDWPKFNFIRFNGRQSLSEADVSNVLADSKAFFKSIQKPLYVKWASADAIQSNQLVGLANSQSGLCHYRYMPAEVASINSGPILKISECTSDAEVEGWWLVNSSGRARESAFASPLWPIVLSKARLGTKYFLYRVREVTVAGSAIDEFEHGFNHWGIAVVPEHKRKGYSKGLTYALSEQLGAKAIFEQVVRNDIRSSFHSHCRSELLRDESRFEEVTVV